MQFLFSKSRFNFSTNEYKSEAFSPFARYIDDIENKRSRLFPDSRTIPGRKFKFLIVSILLINFYHIRQLKLANERQKVQMEQQAAFQRLIVPFFQALVDQQYTITKHRWDLLAKEVLGEDFVKKSNFHNNNVSWVPVYKQIFTASRGGMGRYANSYGQYSTSRGLNGEIKNI